MLCCSTATRILPALRASFEEDADWAGFHRDLKACIYGAPRVLIYKIKTSLIVKLISTSFLPQSHIPVLWWEPLKSVQGFVLDQTWLPTDWRDKKNPQFNPIWQEDLDTHLSTDGGRKEMSSNVRIDLKKCNDLTRPNWCLKSLTWMKSLCSGWGDGSVGKVLAQWAQRLKFRPQHPNKCQAWQYMLITWSKQEKTRSLGIDGQAAYLNRWLQAQWETLSQK